MKKMAINFVLRYCKKRNMDAFKYISKSIISFTNDFSKFDDAKDANKQATLYDYYSFRELI